MDEKINENPLENKNFIGDFYKEFIMLSASVSVQMDMFENRLKRLEGAAPQQHQDDGKLFNRKKNKLGEKLFKLFPGATDEVYYQRAEELLYFLDGIK